MNRVLQTKRGNLNLDHKTLIMGILNVTPDSFSDGGKYNQLEHAINHAIELEQSGADIIDIGGESTRPGHTKVSVDQELSRVIPVIEAVRQAVSIPLSIDTFKSQTAKHALEAGADIINDVWGAKYDPTIAKVAAHYNAPIILMHNRSEAVYQDFTYDFLADLKECVAIAKRSGVTDDQIVLDPGIGFAKTLGQNLEAMRELDRMAELGYPVLLGTSRKSFIEKLTGLPVDQRDEATGATLCYGITKGVDIVRVHNVTMAIRMTKMMDALVGKGDTRYG